jgi:hypothetical protein
MGLPAWREGLDPLKVGRHIAPLIHRGGRALEHIQLLSMAAEMGHTLDGGGSGANNADPFIVEFV